FAAGRAGVRLLVELAARRVTLVDDGDGSASGCGCDRSRKAGGAGTDDEQIHRALLDRLRYRTKIRKLRRSDIRLCLLAVDVHAIGNRRHAGALAGASVDRHEAVVADTHAAEDAALLARGIRRKVGAATLRQRSRDREAGF